MSLKADSYQHWEGRSTGIWRRRYVIAQYGIKLCLQSKVLKILLALVWSSALGLTSIYFLAGQLLSPESGIFANLMEKFPREMTTIINGVTSWILLYPEICVEGLYRGTFFLASNAYIFATFIAVATFIPKLIAHDLSSQAIIIYNSKALTRFDYMLGKFGIVFSILSSLWVLPIVVAWLLGSLMSPGWTFLAHSFDALLRALGIGLLGITSLSLAALAISSLAKKTSTATTFWIFAWIGTGVISGLVGLRFTWGRYISLPETIRHASWNAFDLTSILENAQNMLPFFNVLTEPIKKDLDKALIDQGSSQIVPIIVILLFCLASMAIISLRTKPE